MHNVLWIRAPDAIYCKGRAITMTLLSARAGSGDARAAAARWLKVLGLTTLGQVVVGDIGGVATVPRKTQVFLGFRDFEADHRLHFVAFSFEIFIGGFNGHPVTKIAKSEIGNMIFEQKREETKSVVCSKTQKTLGFPGLCVANPACCGGIVAAIACWLAGGVGGAAAWSVLGGACAVAVGGACTVALGGACSVALGGAFSVAVGCTCTVAVGCTCTVALGCAAGVWR